MLLIYSSWLTALTKDRGNKTALLRAEGTEQFSSSPAITGDIGCVVVVGAKYFSDNRLDMGGRAFLQLQQQIGILQADTVGLKTPAAQRTLKARINDIGIAGRKEIGGGPLRVLDDALLKRITVAYWFKPQRRKPYSSYRTSDQPR